MRKLATPKKKTNKASRKPEPARIAIAKGIKVKFAVYIQNQGDGSASALFFKNEEAAEKFAEKDGERFCEDVSTRELVVDVSTGKILKGLASENEF